MAGFSFVLLSLVAVWLIMLGVGQLIAVGWQLRGASLVGTGRWTGVGLGLLLLLSGAWLLPASWLALGWPLLLGPLVVFIFLWTGSINPPPGPAALFEPDHPAHGSCRRIHIPDNEHAIPAILLEPPSGIASRAAVCVIHGAGDHKTFFKSQLITSLLNKGLTVLTIDLPGHGDYRKRPLSYPEVLSTVPAALGFMHAQPGIEAVGLIGISLGGAIALNSLVDCGRDHLAQALVIAGTPIHLQPDRHMFRREMWRTLYGSPSLGLLKEMSVKQAWQMWKSGGYRSRLTTSELFELLNPVEQIRPLRLPILLVYSRRDSVAPWRHAQAMQQAAPGAAYLETKKASHVMLTLIPEVAGPIADWLKRKLVEEGN